MSVSSSSPSACDGISVHVSVGMPVYNGAKLLQAAIEDVLSQTVAEIEVIISDNCSTDETPEICRAYSGRDPRVRYYRQPALLNPTENYKFVLRQASAPYFMWAAHDDTRDPDYIEKLVAALEANSSAVLAFGDFVQYVDGQAMPLALEFMNKGRSMAGRLRWAALHPLHHLYGVWRTTELRRIDWRHAEWWHDTPLMMAAGLLGDFIHVPGVRFHYLYNRHPFFGWQRKPGLAGKLRDGRMIARRTSDLLELVVTSAVTVGRLAGPVAGLLAGSFTMEKIVRQIFGYVYRRLIGVGTGRHWKPS